MSAMEDKFSSMLLVEGKSEKTVLPELCRLCGVEVKFHIQSENSLNELKKAFKTLLKSTNTLKRLWVIIDADTDSRNAWRSIKDILRKSGKYSFDDKMPLPEDGFIVKPDDESDLTVGIWIMPNNKDIGMLEDFMLTLIPDDNKLLSIAEEMVEQLDSNRANYSGLFKTVHKSKAKIHTWLSWQDAPGISLSVAVQKRLFATDKDLCVRFARWINELNKKR